ncbi:MAG: formylglycine-generating enzyme family protein [Pseudomonadota bacterium]
MSCALASMGVALSPLVSAAAEERDCGAVMEARCADRFGAGAAALEDAAADCAAQRAAYRACVAAKVEASRPTGAGADPSREDAARSAYEAVKDRGSARALDLVAEKFPGTFWGALAAEDAALLRAPAAASATPDARAGATPQAAAVSAADAAERPTAPPPGYDVETFQECAACPRMARIPGGRFVMGSSLTEPGRAADEGLVRQVAVAPFALGVFEVSFAEWDACVAAGGCNGYSPSANGWGRGERPAINVSWRDAEAYIDWLNDQVPGDPYRLPSEAEWEYAARAGTTTPFWWGAAITPGQANYDGRLIYAGGGERGPFRGGTEPVDAFEPNPFGLHQMHGNVSEWVRDCASLSYTGAPKDSRAWRGGDCAQAGLRGGAWDSPPGFLRSAERGFLHKDIRYDSLGFRIARDAP